MSVSASLTTTKVAPQTKTTASRSRCAFTERDMAKE